MGAVEDRKYKMRFYCREEHKMLVKNEKDDEEDAYISDESTSSFFDDSSLSEKSSSSELIDDASSSSSNGPLYGLSDLMDQLPIKRGLSKFYQGKSRSWTTLEKVTSSEELVKKETPYQRRLKACKSYGGGLNNFRSYTHSKPTILKKISKPSLTAKVANCPHMFDVMCNLAP